MAPWGCRLQADGSWRAVAVAQGLLSAAACRAMFRASLSGTPSARSSSVALAVLCPGVRWSASIINIALRVVLVARMSAYNDPPVAHLITVPVPVVLVSTCSEPCFFVLDRHPYDRCTTLTAACVRFVTAAVRGRLVDEPPNREMTARVTSTPAIAPDAPASKFGRRGIPLTLVTHRRLSSGLSGVAARVNQRQRQTAIPGCDRSPASWLLLPVSPG
jgi:hypothetical protein